MSNIRLYQFPTKASPTPSDIVYLGDAANSFDEVQSTIAELIAAYPNLSNIAGLTLGANSYAYNDSTNTPQAGTITPLAVSLLADSTITAMQSTLGYTSSPTANSFAGWDANSNLSANNFVPGYTTTATAASTTTLTVASTYQQFFTGTTTQIVLMPSNSSLQLGQMYLIVNNSTGAVTVKSSGANTIETMASGSSLLLTCISTSTTGAASWNAIYLNDQSFFAPLPLNEGGTNNVLTANAGGILWSDSTKLNILAGTSTAGQLLLSGNAATPSWSTSTYPATNAANTLLYASSANTMAALATVSAGVLTTVSSVPTWATKLGISLGGTNATSVTTAPTASAWAGWDTNSNMSANSFLEGYATTATAASTTTLTVSSAEQQFFTGSTTQTVVLPVTSTLVLGQKYIVVNNSSGTVTVQSSGANTVKAMAASTTAIFTCILTSGTSAASWSVTYITVGSSSPWTAGAGSGSAYGGDGTTSAASDYSLAWGNGSTNTGSSGNNNFSFGNGCAISNSSSYNFLFGRNGAVTGINYSFCFGNAGTVGGAFSFGFGNVPTTSNDYSFAFGHFPTVVHPGSVVWGDSVSTPVGDSLTNQFNLTFANGYRFYKDNSPSLLASFLPTGSSIIGTNTNDNATAGYVGEFVSSVVAKASAVSLSTNTPANVTSISLTAGDWDVEGNVFFNASGGAITAEAVWSSATSASTPDQSLYNGSDLTTAATGFSIPKARYSLASTTPVYLSCTTTFAAGTATACGGIYARRIR